MKKAMERKGFKTGPLIDWIPHAPALDLIDDKCLWIICMQGERKNVLYYKGMH